MSYIDTLLQGVEECLKYDIEDFRISMIYPFKILKSINLINPNSDK